jgi:nucleoside-diphosphate-sugar epimerase
MRIAVTGAAGLVGLNLMPVLKSTGAHEIIAFDKHPMNTKLLRHLHPNVDVREVDLAEAGPSHTAISGADYVVIGHAQIGGMIKEEFQRNNVVATQRVIDALPSRGACRLIHISSSVVNSAAVDWYTESKKAQEKLVLAAGYPTMVLRPTLMFGPFDRKHLGWLAQFMRKAPFFPIPGDGRYPRQPLYVRDFCSIIGTAIFGNFTEGIYDISGQEQINFIDLIRLVRKEIGVRVPLVPIPYRVFWLLLRSYALIDRNPPFTTKQLEALVTPDKFSVTEWPRTFGIAATPLAVAMRECFSVTPDQDIVLRF